MLWELNAAEVKHEAAQLGAEGEAGRELKVGSGFVRVAGAGQFML